MTLIYTKNDDMVTLQRFLPSIANGIVAFTAPDCLDTFLHRIPEGSDRPRRATISGDQLLRPFALCDGIIFNPLGPGPVWGLPYSFLPALSPEQTAAQPPVSSAGEAPSTKKPWWKLW